MGRVDSISHCNQPGRAKQRDDEGFDASDVDFRKNDIWISWAGISVTPDTRIVLDVDFA